jgi:hypothetical protein
MRELSNQNKSLVVIQLRIYFVQIELFHKTGLSTFDA